MIRLPDIKRLGDTISRSGVYGYTADQMREYAELIRADEREACAKVVLEMKGQCWAYDHDTIAAAIRARGDT